MQNMIIHMKNGLAESVSYDINGKHYTESCKKIMCKFINSSIPAKWSKTGEKYNLYPHATKHFSPSFGIKTENPENWMHDEDLRTLGERFQKEIFYFDVKYSVNSNHLLFVSVKNNISAEYSNCIFPLKELFLFSPSVYSIRMHFDALKSCFYELLLKHSSPTKDTTIPQELFLLSDEFINPYFHKFLITYCPESLVFSDFSSGLSDMELLSFELSPEYLLQDSYRSGFSFSKSANYNITHNDIFTAYFRKNFKAICKHLCIEPFRNPESQKKAHASSRFINDYFYSPDTNGYFQKFDYYNNAYAFTYTDFNNHKSITKKEILNIDNSIFREINDQAMRLWKYFNSLNNMNYASTLLFMDDSEDNPLLVLSGQADFNFMEYLNTMEDICPNFSRKIEDSFDDNYMKTDIDIPTNSMLKVLQSCFSSYQKDDTLSLRKCDICGWYFIPKTPHDKYCSDTLITVQKLGKNITCKEYARKKAHSKNTQKLQIQDTRKNRMRLFTADLGFFTSTEKTFPRRKNYPNPSLCSKKADDFEEVMKFLFSYFYRGILFQIYEKEKKFIYDTFKSNWSNADKEKLYYYALSLMPNQAEINKLNYPSEEYYRTIFYEEDMGIHPIGFDWHDELSAIFNDNPDTLPEPKIAYIEFKKWIKSKKGYIKSKNISSTVKNAYYFLENLDPELKEFHLLQDDQSIPKRLPRKR